MRAKGKPVSGYVIPHPKVAPKNFCTKWVAPIAVSVLLPDVQAWQDCGGGDLSQCGWSATDLPLLKPLKAIKGAKKAIDAASTAAKKCHSFLPGTRVLLADGTSKKIEDVEKGDVVLATDPDTGEKRSKEVIETILTKDDKDFTELSVTTETGEASIVATDTHPFWSVNQKKWLDAGEVQPGTKLLTSDGRDVEVISARHYTKRQQTHDLTVEGIHTYYVLAGATPVLVHNCGTGAVSDKVMDEHILPRHDANHADSWKWAEKSKFEDWVTPDHIRNWSKLAMRKPMDNMNLGTGSARRHILDIRSRHPIGYDADGNDLFSVAVWVRNGAVESVHPN
ncbi:Hint domain-containing protein [Streptomyces sp. NPDC001787]|uniref:Hint domain-containing protein n=1 Tax=Streptomyces sp. NPDC001787 TaxID=3154523 RepID=UPI00332B722A